MKSSLKWKRARTIFPTDHIISSKAREVGTLGFKPQYENVKHVNFRFLLSNEYMRLWFKERELYQKENYSTQEKVQNEAHLQRRFVQRMMINPKLETKELPIIQLKRFQNIMSKIDTRRTVEEKTKICERYPKTVLPIELTRYKPACPTQKPKINATNTANASGKTSQSPKQKRNANEQVESKKVKTPPLTSPQKEKTEPCKGKNCAFVCELV